MRRLILLFAAHLAGCAAPGVSQVSPTLIPRPGTAKRVPPPTASSSAPRQPVHGALCYANGHPAPPAKKVDEGNCGAFDAAELTRVEAEVRRRFVIRERPSKLVVDFGCDRAAQSIDDVVLEDGSGHGGTLRIVRFHRDGDRVVIRTIDSSHYQSPGVTVRRAEITPEAFDKLVSHSRVALLARPHLLSIQVPGGMGAFSFSISSNDFHLHLRLSDDEAHVTERGFTGYDSSSEQEQILPMQMATEGWEKLLGGLSTTEEAATDDDRLFFSRRFLQTFSGETGWWVEERYVSLAATLGTVDLVPKLAALAARRGDASRARVRDAAVSAVTAITGWNARVDRNGDTRTPEEAAAAVSVECAIAAAEAP